MFRKWANKYPRQGHTAVGPEAWLAAGELSSKLCSPQKLELRNGAAMDRLHFCSQTALGDSYFFTKAYPVDLTAQEMLYWQLFP